MCVCVWVCTLKFIFCAEGNSKKFALVIRFTLHVS